MTNFENLLKWAEENKARGCIRTDMRNTAIKDGWSPQIVDSVLAQAFDRIDITQPKYQISETTPGLKLFGGSNIIEVQGQIIKIALTSKLPQMILFENFLSDQECDQLAEMSKPLLTRSTGVNVATGVGEITTARTSTGTFFRRGSHPLINKIDQRISELLDWPESRGEDLQILHYENGEQYIPHHDYFHEEYEGSRSIIQRGGNRVATLLMYLATPSQGGSTSFPDVGLNIYPQKGNAVFFIYPTPTADTRTLHGGSPVILGEKYVATKWLRWGDFQ